MNVGVQREIRPGMVLTVDYLRNVGLHYLIGQDINHTGDVAFFNQNAATNAINLVNGSFGCGTGIAGVDCAIAAGATGGSYAHAGLDSPYDLGSGACAANTVLAQWRIPRITTARSAVRTRTSVTSTNIVPVDVPYITGWISSSSRT